MSLINNRYLKLKIPNIKKKKKQIFLHCNYLNHNYLIAVPINVHRQPEYKSCQQKPHIAINSNTKSSQLYWKTHKIGTR